MQGVRIDCACINSQSSFIFLNFRNSWRFAGLAAKDFDQEESLFYCPSSTWVSYTIFSPSMVSEWHDLHLNKTRVQWSSWLLCSEWDKMQIDSRDQCEKIGTVFENQRKSLIQHCERSELRLHFIKFIKKSKISLASFWKTEAWGKKCYQTGWLVETAKIETFKWDILGDDQTMCV